MRLPQTPKGWNTGWHGSYDYSALSKYADYLMIMAYDEHYQGSPAGPVAGMEFVEESIKYALKHVPKEKIVLGVPFFGRVWGPGRALTAGRVTAPGCPNEANLPGRRAL